MQASLVSKARPRPSSFCTHDLRSYDVICNMHQHAWHVDLESSSTRITAGDDTGRLARIFSPFRLRGQKQFLAFGLCTFILRVPIHRILEVLCTSEPQSAVRPRTEFSNILQLLRGSQSQHVWLITGTSRGKAAESNGAKLHSPAHMFRG